jgi:hypothetical protein
MEIVVRLLESILDAIRRPSPTSPWLTATQADKYVHQRQGTVSRLCRAGVIESRKVNSTRYVHTDWLDAWMMAHPDGTEPTFSALRPSSR